METKIEEIWKDVVGYEGKYKVSNLGAIKSNNRVIKLPVMKNGYCKAMLSIRGERKNFRAHRVVAEAFILNPEKKPFVNHINGIKTDNRVENLEWCTASENTLHSVKIKTHPKQYGQFNPASKLSQKDVIDIKTLSLMGKTTKELSVWYSVSTQHINRIKRGARWGHLS